MYSVHTFVVGYVNNFGNEPIDTCSNGVQHPGPIPSYSTASNATFTSSEKGIKLWSTK